MFYPQAEIVRIMTPGGRRIGGILKQAGQPDILLAPRDIYLLGDRLYKNQQSLQNASITADGRIRSRTGKQVTEKQMDEQTFNRLYRPLQFNQDGVSTAPRAQTQLKQPANQKPVRLQTQAKPKTKPIYTPHGVVQRFDRYGVRPSTTEVRLGTIIEEGIRLANEAGVRVRITKIETARTKEDKSKPYMTVTAVCEQFEPEYTKDVKFSARLNGKVLLSVWKPAPPVETSIDGDIFSMFEVTTPEGDTVETTQCRSSNDIYALLYYYAASGKPQANQTLLANAERIMRESHNELAKNPTPITYVYPHKRIDGTFKNHIQSLEHLRAELNARFTGTYSFIWNIQHTSAVLSVVGYDSIRTRQSLIDANASLREKILKDKFSDDANLDHMKSRKIPTATELLNDIKTEALVELHLQLTPTPAVNTVAMRHRLLRENRLWISLEEHLRMEYVDEVCDAVQFIMDEVLKQGFIRGSISVLAYGKVDGKDKYLLSDRPNPVTLEELLDLRDKHLIEGVAFKKTPSGQFELIENLDRDGDVLPKFADIKGVRYISITYDFRDTKADEPVTLSTAIPWNDYMSFKNLARREQVTLKTPQRMIEELTVAPNKQLNAITPISSRLATYAKEKFYSPKEAVELLQDFMLCFRYSKLMDVLRSNRTPLEMLVDRKGCCLELSLLASVILSRMGLESALLLSYSPALDTRYHAVSGVRVYTDETENIDAVALQKVGVDGFKALELTLGHKCNIGEAAYWAKPDKCSGATAGAWGISDPREISQTVLVPLSSTMQPRGASLLKDDGITRQLEPFGPLYWQNILNWFNDKKFIPH